LKDKIESLENQVFSLQGRMVDLESTLENSKYALSGTLEDPETMKSIHQGGL
jgi:chaperonin cofactor prefoldin